MGFIAVVSRKSPILRWFAYWDWAPSSSHYGISLANRAIVHLERVCSLAWAAAVRVHFLTSSSTQ